jgi:hypothetical protein
MRYTQRMFVGPERQIHVQRRDGESHAGHQVMPYRHRNKSSSLEFCRVGRSRSCEAFVNPAPREIPAADGFSKGVVMG